MRFLARIALCAGAAILYTFAFIAITVVVYAFTHDDPPPEPPPPSNDAVTVVVELDPMPTWVASLYLAGLAGVVFLVGFRLSQKRAR